MSRANPNFFSIITKSLLLLSLVTGAAILSVSPSLHPTVGASSSYSVTIIDYAFQPLHINITTGTTVTWTYTTGSTIHTVTSDPGTNQTQGGAPLLSSGDLNPGQSFSYTFDLPGYYPYQCAVHPTIARMNGWVMVTGNPITPSGSLNGSSFPWVLVAGVVVAAVVAAVVALVFVRRRKPQPVLKT